MSLAALPERRRFALGALTVDLDAYRVCLAGRVLPLSPSQVRILAFLVANHGRVVSREEVARAAGLQAARSVDVLLSTLRREVGPNFVRNVRNRGWILVPVSLGASDRMPRPRPAAAAPERRWEARRGVGGAGLP